ncbi:MAG: HAD-IIA family hydrolase [Actinomycetota bacterium]|nr:HAD-IIA family hydrolase [Actinomycetota bacterium]MED6327549.1 HAD-IIA family hydrolase [Actinomycetota bacterium]MEE2958018.1 HAD-IIA family hydrolase [Actinomycetota bacterium]
MPWALDLDGVVWRGIEGIPGSAEAVRLLQEAGERVLFVTNNSGRPVSDTVDKLAGLGIDAMGGVVTSGMAAAALVSPSERVLGMCGPGCREELERVGAEVVRDGPADAVVVGFHDDFDYWRLTAAVQAVLGGARLIGTNDDVTFPAHDGLRPGAGSLLAAVRAATGVEPELAGKPYGPMCEVVQSLVAAVDGECVMVGDRPDTDGRFARALGWRWSLVLSGLVGVDDLPVDPEPDTVHDDLLAAVRDHLG